METFIFTIRFNKRFFTHKKDVKRRIQLPNVNHVSTFARFAYNEFRNAKEVKVTDIKGNFILLYAKN